MFPKDKESITKQSNIIYWYKCGRTECDNEYTGESTRTLGERYTEHLKGPHQYLNIIMLLVTNTSGKLQDYRKGGTQYGQNHLRSHLHQCQQPNPQQKHWQIQPATYLGQGSVFHPRTENLNKAHLHHNISALKGLLQQICTVTSLSNKYLCITTSVL